MSRTAERGKRLGRRHNRGIAELVSGRHETVVFWTVAVVILVSIAGHGITGTPFSRRLTTSARI
jgi:hypothetical protein